MVCPGLRDEDARTSAAQFTGTDQVRETWETVFRTTPDFEATLLNLVEDGTTVWAELRYSRTQGDGTPMDLRGVVIFGVENGTLARGRVYLEPSEAGDEIRQELYEVEVETDAT